RSPPADRRLDRARDRHGRDPALHVARRRPAALPDLRDGRRDRRTRRRVRVDHLLGLEVASATGRVEEVRHGALSWLMIERPGTAELTMLEQRFAFHSLDLEDLVSKTERPKVDSRLGYVFLVLHFPVLAGRPRRLMAGELHVFIGSDYLVTVHDGDLR